MGLLVIMSKKNHHRTYIRTIWKSRLMYRNSSKLGYEEYESLKRMKGLATSDSGSN
jgi:hypothetical protein